MTKNPAPLGPVSAALEAQLREEVRRHGAVFFLDKEGSYTDFVHTLIATSPPYPVCAYRGSFLELLMALEHHGAGVDKAPLLVHLPGFVEDDVKASPLYEMYAAGVRFRKALDTLVAEAAHGRVRPDQIEAFRSEGPITIEAADAWLSAADAAGGQGLEALLRGMALEAIVDDLLSNGHIAKQIQSARDDKEAEKVWQHFAKATGMPDTWRETYQDLHPPRARDVAFTATSWILVVEYTMDLARPPVDERLTPIRELSKPVIESCRKFAEYLRDRHPDFYKAAANETETWIPSETAILRAEDLGKVDTFVCEEVVILKGALAALETFEHQQALAWAEPRAAAKSFWTKHEPARQNAWQLVLDAARLGRALAEAGPSLGTAKNLDEATDRYVAVGAAVDRAHRILEQRRLAVLYPQIPHFGKLRSQLDTMRARWREWADAWARGWNAVCRDTGFLPSAERQQRTLFEQVVRPLAVDSAAPSEVTAYFLVDALRYEMAEEIFEALGEIPATQKQLRPRLAELPTVTEMGMNVLAPVSDGARLKPVIQSGAIKGLAAGEFRVSGPETRKRAIFDRIGGRGCPWLTLEEVLSRDSDQLRKTVEQARLLVVHSQQIDEAGEKGVGPTVFDKVLQDLRAAWRLLREAGTRRFVITTDHGFLLLDDRMGEAKAHGRKIDPKRRHVFSPVPADHSGEVRVALKDLAYDGVEGHLMFPDTVAVFDTGARGKNFVHGGNSPQERVIPVLTLVHRHSAGSDTHGYVITMKPAEGLAGMHCIQAGVTVTQSSLFGGKKAIELKLRAPENPGVMAELAQVRGKARLVGSVIQAEVGGEFEVFFRLLGPSEDRVRVYLCAAEGEAPNLQTNEMDVRFAVILQRERASSADTPKAAGSRAWLERLPPGVRQLFEHLAAHGAITETEAGPMLGGPRELRKFAREFEDHRKLVPFRVHVDVVGGVKRYVREGGDG